MFDVDWVQHPAGHGGFHTGRARSEGSVFSWIFDCGSRGGRTFDALLSTWTTHNRHPVDWLFISHFDTDHVSGLDTLMARVLVDNVMVPYVSEHDLAIQLLHEIDRGNLSRAFYELVADPAAYFLERGADRVTFLRGRSSGEDPDGFEPGPERPRDDRRWHWKIRPRPTGLPAPRVARTGRSTTPEVRLVDGPCEIAAIHGDGRLLLKPYRAPIPDVASKGLVADLAALVGYAPRRSMRPGLRGLAFLIGLHARTPEGRSRLRRLYKKHAGSSNRSSMSLLSFPIPTNTDAGWTETSGPTMHRWTGGARGWLNTGDAELINAADLSGWTTFYGADLKDVDVLALPHHGSDKNSGKALQDACGSALLVAHVKDGAKKHPGLDVSAFAGGRLACVTGQSGTQVRMRYTSS